MASTTPSHPNQLSALWGDFGDDARIRLLEAIDRHGSISRAASAVPLSYKAAWDAVDHLNNLSHKPLVRRVAGGRQGGGTALTDEGRKVVTLYRTMEAEYRRALAQLSSVWDEQTGQDMQRCQQLLRRLNLRTSARNQFVCELVELHLLDLHVEVVLRIEADLVLTAHITRQSVDTLGLQVGQQVVALFKASAVQWAPAAYSDSRHLRTNRVSAPLSQISTGAQHSELSMALASGKSLVATVPHGDLPARSLVPGDVVSVVVPPASIILSTLD